MSYFFAFFVFLSTLYADHALVGIYAISMSTKEVILEKNSDKSFMPASCMKVVTAGAALALLPEERPFHTDLVYEGLLEGGILQGNVCVIGGGDPCLGSERLAFSSDTQIQRWVDAIYDLGIRKIQGRVIGDASFWEEAMAVPSWEWEDLGNYYGVGASALSFHENSYSLVFAPGDKVGAETKILRIEPEVFGLEMQNRVLTGELGSGDNASIYGCEYSALRYARGTIPLGVQEFTIRGGAPNPALWVETLLTKALEKKGILVEKKVFPTAAKTLIYRQDSPSLSQIVYEMNQQSINLYAEHLIKKIGEGNTERGVSLCKEFWKSKNIDMTGFQMVDGSGLSRKNLLTPKQMVSILCSMKENPYFRESLPSIGKQGKAKSGFMSLARGYAGYIGDIAFAVFVNNSTDPQEAKAKLTETIDFLENKNSSQ
jgi:D-alanyl-D-alanine carboxypeptidase/D-alanyl-D-alanine-endopeptidase (penicillin-binding protein 4)